MSEYKVDELMVGVRLDKYLMNVLELSRSKVQKLIDNDLVEVNDKPMKNSYLVKLGDEIKLLTNQLEEEFVIEKENIPLDIVFEDDHIIIINKESGMVVHPAVGNRTHTLVNALLYHFDNLPQHENNRPGIVHRIDKDTSGLLIVCKSEIAFDKVSDMIRKHEINRKYIALVHGQILNDTGTIDAPIGRDTFDRKKMCVTAINSKSSVTNFKVLKRYEKSTLIECVLETGRTHQIRVHMKYIKFPIINDLVYGHKKCIDKNYGQLLHAYSLSFNHPITNEFMEFKTELPKKFKELMNEYNGEEEDYDV